jgi:hypothetical protein
MSFGLVLALSLPVQGAVKDQRASVVYDRVKREFRLRAADESGLLREYRVTNAKAHAFDLLRLEGKSALVKGQFTREGLRSGKVTLNRINEVVEDPLNLMSQKSRK